MTAKICIIACGALAREITALISANRLEHVSLVCLPAKLHNNPQAIPGAVKAAIEKAQDGFDEILVAYGDCGTGGALDAVLETHGVRRIEGPHCYSFFSTNDVFATREETDLGSFYLTDFLVRQFDTLVVKPLGLDRHPQLRDIYFGNYRKLVYLAQTRNADLSQRAHTAAQRLGLVYEHRQVGYGGLDEFVNSAADLTPTIRSLSALHVSSVDNRECATGDNVNIQTHCGAGNGGTDYPLLARHSR